MYLHQLHDSLDLDVLMHLLQNLIIVIHVVAFLFYFVVIFVLYVDDVNILLFFYYIYIYIYNILYMMRKTIKNHLKNQIINN